MTTDTQGQVIRREVREHVSTSSGGTEIFKTTITNGLGQTLQEIYDRYTTRYGPWYHVSHGVTDFNPTTGRPTGETSWHQYLSVNTNDDAVTAITTDRETKTTIAPDSSAIAEIITTDPASGLQTRVTTATDPAGHVTSRRTETRSASAPPGAWLPSEEYQATYNTQGQLTQEKTVTYWPIGSPKVATAVTYDPATGTKTNEVVTTFNPAGAPQTRTTTWYNLHDAANRGEMVEQWGPDGAWHRQSVTTWTATETIVETYDPTTDHALTRTVAAADGRREATRYGTDAQGRPTATTIITDPQGRKTQEIVTVYTPTSLIQQTRTATTFDPATGAKTQEVVETYDPAGVLQTRTTTLYDPTTGQPRESTTTTFDPATGQPTQEYRATTDAQGRLVGTWTTFNAQGQVVSRRTKVYQPGIEGLPASDTTVTVDPATGRPTKEVAVTYGTGAAIAQIVTTLYDPTTGAVTGIISKTFDTQGQLVGTTATTIGFVPGQAGAPAQRVTTTTTTNATGRVTQQDVITETRRTDGTFAFASHTVETYTTAADGRAVTTRDYLNAAGQRTTQEQITATPAPIGGGQWPGDLTRTTFDPTTGIVLGRTVTTADGWADAATSNIAQTVRTQTYDGENRLINEETTTYGRIGGGIGVLTRTATTVTFDPATGLPITRETLTYDPATGQVTSQRQERYVNGAWHRQRATTWTYDSSSGSLRTVLTTTLYDPATDQRQQEVVETWAAGTPQTRLTTTFNAAGQETGQTHERYVNGAWQPVTPPSPHLPGDPVTTPPPAAPKPTAPPQANPAPSMPHSDLIPTGIVITSVVVDSFDGTQKIQRIYDPTTGAVLRETVTTGPWGTIPEFVSDVVVTYLDAHQRVIVKEHTYTEQFAGAFRYTVVYAYDEQGIVIGETAATYDPQGRPRSQTVAIFASGTGELVRKTTTTSTYDDRGRLLQEVEVGFGYRGVGPLWETTRTFDVTTGLKTQEQTVGTDSHDRREVTVKTFNAQGFVTVERTTTYQPGSQQIAIETVLESDGHGHTVRVESVSYDDQRRLQAHTVQEYNPETQLLTSVLVETFDAAGARTRSVAVAYDLATGRPTTRTTITYDPATGRQTGQTTERYVNGAWQPVTPPSPNLPAETLTGPAPAATETATSGSNPVRKQSGRQPNPVPVAEPTSESSAPVTVTAAAPSTSAATPPTIIVAPTPQKPQEGTTPTATPTDGGTQTTTKTTDLFGGVVTTRRTDANRLVTGPLVKVPWPDDLISDWDKWFFGGDGIAISIDEPDHTPDAPVPAVPIPQLVPPTLQIQPGSDGTIKLIVRGPLNARYDIEAASAVEGPWESVAKNLVIPENPGFIERIEPTGPEPRFYRAKAIAVP